MSEVYIALITIWSIVSFNPPEGHMQTFIITIVIIEAVSLISRVICKKALIPTGGKVLRSALCLNATGAMIAYSYGEINDVLSQIIWSVAALFLMSIIKILKLDRLKITGIIAFGSMPLLLILTRVLGEPKDGSYLSITNSVLTVGVLMMMLPFAMAFILHSQSEIERLGSRATALPLNQVFLLVNTILIAILAGLVNSEFGTALIITGTTATLFLIYGRNMISKIILCLTSFMGVVVVMMFSSKMQIRTLIMYDMEQAMISYPGEAYPVKFLQDTATSYGLYGMGAGQLPRAVITNVTSDYVWSGLLYNQGLLFTIATLAIAVYMIVGIYKIPTESAYDRIILQSTSFMLSIMLLLSFGGCVGALPLTGIGFPLLSTCKSINTSVWALIGAVVIIDRKASSHERINKHQKTRSPWTLYRCNYYHTNDMSNNSANQSA